MGVTISADLSSLTCTLRHGPSGAALQTTPPADNGGEGSSFSPTDLVAAALASCALTTMALIAAREGLVWGDASATIIKEMTGPPRRIGELPMVFTLPAAIPVEQRPRIEEIAQNCPVALSLASGVQVAMAFEYR
jgi:putative redox protein